MNDSHYRFQCEHGTLISQCRCPDGSVTIMDKCPPTCPHKDLAFDIGSRVRKPKGAYDFESEVRSVFRNKNGDVRLVCESLVIPGMLHIFSPEQMELMPDE